MILKPCPKHNRIKFRRKLLFFGVNGKSVGHITHVMG